MEEKEILARIRLHLAPGVGPRRHHTLIRQYGNARKVLEAPRSLLRGVLDGEAIAWLSSRRSEQEAHKELRKTERLGARILPHTHPDYPAALGRIPTPPPLLWVAGRWPRRSGVALVGRRAASKKGRELTNSLAARLADEGLSVISGGAYGIDAAAHKGCLEAGGLTVCVLGSSLDRPYPERHMGLFKEIVRRGGTVVSHLKLSTEPHRGCFLQRNRIIAGLSLGVCVVEAGLRSGARNTAMHARKLQIPVMAVPGTSGTMKLLSEGAYRVEDAEDVLGVVLKNHIQLGVEPEGELPASQRELLAATSVNGGRTPDELSALCGLSLGETLSSLTELELLGLITPLPGNRYLGAYKNEKRGGA